MSITELALLHLVTSSKHPSPTLQATLQHAQAAQTAFSTHQVTLFTQASDPAYIYLLGGWDSTEQHYNEWVPSPTNQGLLREIMREGEVEVAWMVHVGVEPGFVREVVESSRLVGQGRGGGGGRQVVCVVWGFVRNEKREVFEGAFGDLQRRMSEGREGSAVGGWRVETAGDEREAFVIFSGVEGFAESAELAGMKQFLDDDVQVWHMVRWID